MIGRVSDTSPAGVETKTEQNTKETPGNFENLLAFLLQKDMIGGTKMETNVSDSSNGLDSSGISSGSIPVKNQDGVSDTSVKDLLKKAAGLISMSMNSGSTVPLVDGQTCTDVPANTGSKLRKVSTDDKTGKGTVEEKTPNLLENLLSILPMGTSNIPVGNLNQDPASAQAVKMGDTVNKTGAGPAAAGKTEQANNRSGIDELIAEIAQDAGILKKSPAGEKQNLFKPEGKNLPDTGPQLTDVNGSKDISGVQSGGVNLNKEQPETQANRGLIGNMLQDMSGDMHIEILQESSAGSPENKIPGLTGTEGSKASSKATQNASASITEGQKEDAAAVKPAQESGRRIESMSGAAQNRAVQMDIKARSADSKTYGSSQAGDTEKAQLQSENNQSKSSNIQSGTPIKVEGTQNKIQNAEILNGGKAEPEVTGSEAGHKASNEYSGDNLSRRTKSGDNAKYQEKMADDVEKPFANRMETYKGSSGITNSHTSSVHDGSEIAKQSAVPEKENVLNQVYDKIKDSNITEVHELNVNLKPDELGQVVIKIAMDKGMLTGKILVENSHVKSLVESGLSGIKESLKEQNINLNDVSVSVDTGSAGAYYNHGQGNGNGNNRWAHTNNAYLRVNSINISNDMNPSKENGNSGMLNLLA